METTDAIGSVVHSKFEHAFDANHNRKFERRGHDGDKGDNYVYDSADRLVTFERGVAAVNVGAPGSGPAYPKKDFQLDGVQNWRKVTTNGVATTLAVSAVNAYTSIVTGGIIEQPVHDADGNMTSPHGLGSPLITLKYDFQNRLREITNGTDSVFHDYDASGRRIRTYTSGSVPGCPPWVEYVHDDWEVIEEFDGSNNLMRRFVMGNELDEPLRMDTFSFWPTPGTYYFQRSTLGHVVALSNSTGAVVERYTYDAYGAPAITNILTGTTPSQSDYGNPYMFTGRRYEPWIRSLYEFRHRFMDPALARFVQRDPLGLWGDKANNGSGVAFVGCRATNGRDPLGLYDIDAFLSDMADIGYNTASAFSAAANVITLGATDAIGEWVHGEEVMDRYRNSTPIGQKVGNAAGTSISIVSTGAGLANIAQGATGGTLLLSTGTLVPATGAATGAGGVAVSGAAATFGWSEIFSDGGSGTGSGSGSGGSKPTKTDRHKEHTTETDIRGAQKELAGGKSGTNPLTGKPWQHLEEVRNTQRGLVNRIEQIKKQLCKYDLLPPLRKALEDELGKASKLLDMTEEYLPR